MKLLKDFLRFLGFSLLDSFIPQGPIKEKTLVILKLDVIGDYILFRNFLEDIKNSQQYAGYRITLIGNSVYKDLALGLDSGLVDDFIFINFKSMTRNLIYRFKTFREIVQNGYEVVINPTYSREFNVTDSLVKVINAREKIGSVGILGNIVKWQKNISDSYYTRLIPVLPGIQFEFLQNKAFIEGLLRTKISRDKPTCNLETEANSKSYAVLFPGAGTQARRWPLQNFVKVAEHLIHTYGYDVIVLGGSAEVSDGDEIWQRVKNDHLINLSGKTSLIETLKIIKGAKLLVSNETSAPHMAAMVDTPTVVLYNGNNFRRFIPYPKSIFPAYFSIYHPKIEENFDDYELKSNTPGYLSQLNIDDIKVETVISVIKQVSQGNK